MKPSPQFLRLPMQFWALVRLISQEAGYTERGEGRIKVAASKEMEASLLKIDLDPSCVITGEKATPLGSLLIEYFQYRADILNDRIEPLLMDKKRAEKLFKRLRKELKPQCPIPMNKQKGEKRKPAYMTGIVNMLIESNIEGLPCEYDPRKLITIVRDNIPIRTLARRIDGAFPSTINPLAVWEIKEYYNTTTFGSRVADGIYETLLDGMEILELKQNENIALKHYLIVDDHYTWWDCGRSYLCRIVDMLHMGHVDEVIFGEEVVERMPLIVKEWVHLYRAGQVTRD